MTIQENGAPSDLERREIAFVTETFSAVRPWKQALDLIDFPQDKRGLLCVDVGAGVSESTVVLATQGAISVAIDPRYGDIEKLISDVRKKPITEMGRAEVERVIQRFKHDFVSKAKIRGKYLSGFAGKLPFRDNEVDFYFSLHCVTNFLDKDWDLFFRAIEEAIRVIKPGGEIQIAPYMDMEVIRKYGVGRGLSPSYFAENEKRNVNQLRMLEHLKQRNDLIAEVVRKTNPRGPNQPIRLSIRKIIPTN